MVGVHPTTGKAVPIKDMIYAWLARIGSDKYVDPVWRYLLSYLVARVISSRDIKNLFDQLKEEGNKDDKYILSDKVYNGEDYTIENILNGLYYLYGLIAFFPSEEGVIKALLYIKRSWYPFLFEQDVIEVPEESVETTATNDLNNNGIPDNLEQDLNNNGIPDYLEIDNNNNGIPDYFEQ